MQTGALQRIIRSPSADRRLRWGVVCRLSFTPWSLAGRSRSHSETGPSDDPTITTTEQSDVREHPQKLLELLKARSFKSDPFRLASGGASNYFIDGKMTEVCSEGAYLIGEVLYELTKDLNIDAIGGLQVGAVPLTTAAVIRLPGRGAIRKGFWVREEVKSHGTQKLIEGGLKPGMRVVILDDVCTKGGSAASHRGSSRSGMRGRSGTCDCGPIRRGRGVISEKRNPPTIQVFPSPRLRDRRRCTERSRSRCALRIFLTAYARPLRSYTRAATRIAAKVLVYMRPWRRSERSQDSRGDRPEIPHEMLPSGIQPPGQR